MPHIAEVDQSIRFEDTQHDTALALANGIHYSILIPAAVKRDCIKILRAQDQNGKTPYIKLFAVALFLLLRKHIERLTRVYIDREYLGKDGQIKDHLVNTLRRSGYDVEHYLIQFTHVGKKSPAHLLAIQTFRRQKKPHEIIKLNDLLREFRTKK